MTQFERDIKEGNAPGREGHGRKPLSLVISTARRLAECAPISHCRLYESRYGGCPWRLHQVRSTRWQVILHIADAPGYSYDVSPMKVVHTETRQSFAHFLTS